MENFIFCAVYDLFPGIQKRVNATNIDFPFSVKLIMFVLYF